MDITYVPDQRDPINPLAGMALTGVVAVEATRIQQEEGTWSYNSIRTI